MDDEQGKRDYDIMLDIKELLSRLSSNKPNDRSEKDRRYAVTITELEKVFAYFKAYVVDELQ